MRLAIKNNTTQDMIDAFENRIDQIESENGITSSDYLEIDDEEETDIEDSYQY